jgi:hypothetical protein
LPNALSRASDHRGSFKVALRPRFPISIADKRLLTGHLGNSNVSSGLGRSLTRPLGQARRECPCRVESFLRAGHAQANTVKLPTHQRVWASAGLPTSAAPSRSSNACAAQPGCTWRGDSNTARSRCPFASASGALPREHPATRRGFMNKSFADRCARQTSLGASKLRSAQLVSQTEKDCSMAQDHRGQVAFPERSLS